jgi:hypothetical protein
LKIDSRPRITQKMAEINYELMREILFTNEEAFTDINIKEAKIILRTCKIARTNKNIKFIYDKCKIDIYYKQIMFLAIKKAEKEFNENILDETSGATNLNINKKYKRKVYNIIIGLLKENDDVVEGVKEKLVAEQKKNINKYFIKLHVKLAIVGAYDNIIDDDDAETFENDDKYNDVQFEIVFIITNYKFNAYFLNMLSKTLVNEKDVISYISSKYFTDNWYRIPIIFPENHCKNYNDGGTGLLA